MSEDAQRPSTIHLDVEAPEVTRTRTSTQLFLGVSADQDATSWVKPKPGVTGVEVQLPTSYAVPW